MDDLRTILAIIGVGVIAFVYWYTRHEQKRRSRAERVEPAFSAETAAESAADDAAGEPAAESGEEAAPVQDVLAADPDSAPAEKEKIVAIRLVARTGRTIPGEELILAMRGLGLRHGKFGIFHRHAGDDDAIVFSVASLLEPGSFELATIREQELPGVSMFMVLPGVLPGTEAFDGMVETARALAKSVDAEVLDAAGSSLSIQRERFIREEIIQYEHSRQVAQQSLEFGHGG